jgi:tetratricopeptide (TPR) repeat protein
MPAKHATANSAADLVLTDLGSSAGRETTPPVTVLALSDGQAAPSKDGGLPSQAADPSPSEPAPFECDGTATTDDLLASAREMFLTDNRTLAEMLYKCVLRRDPNNLAAILELSVVYEAMGKLQYARGLISRAAILKPRDQDIIDRSNELARKLSNALRVEVDSLMSAGAFETALPKLSVLLSTDPADAELHYKKALCYASLKDWDGALPEIESALRLKKDPRYEALRVELADRTATLNLASVTRNTKRLIAAGRPEEREKTLAGLSEILRRDSGNAWARDEFVRLTKGSDSSQPVEEPVIGKAAIARTLQEAEVRSRSIVRASKSAAEEAAVFLQGTASTIERHMGLLIAALIVLALFRSPIAFMIVRGFEPRQFLSGRLKYFNIHEVLSMIHSQGRSGVLRIYSRTAKGRVYFSDGEIFHCTCGKLKGRDAVRRLLASAKDGHFVLTKLPRAYKKTIDLPFSLILMDLRDRSTVAAAGGPMADTPAALQAKSKMKSLLENKV